MNARLVGCVAACALIGVTAGCDDQFPDPLERSTIRGKVTYEGTAHENFSRPAVQVMAFYTFPPATTPNSLHVTEDLEGLADGGVSYELREVVPFDYYILGQLFDLDDRDDLTVPAGGYPDFCALSATSAPLTVAAFDDVDGIDFTLHDAAGSTDPCASDPSVCPEPGFATLVVNITSAMNPADLSTDDLLLVALFTQFPPNSFPVVSTILPSSQLEFPMTVKYTNVPTDELVLYACLDIGGDNTQSLCGDSDVWTLFDGGSTHAFMSGKVVTFDLDLDDGTSSTTVQDKSELNCE